MFVEGTNVRRIVLSSLDELTKSTTAPEVSTHDTADHGAYMLHRILNGVSEGFDDMPPLQAFPMESNLDIMGGCEYFA